MSSYLNSRYDLTNAFPTVNRYSISKTCTKDALIYLSAAAWASGVYAVGDLVSYTDGKVYKCIAVTTNQAPTDAAKWTAWGLNKTFYSVVADVAAGIALTNATYYLEGDTRAELLVRHVMNISLYELRRN